MSLVILAATWGRSLHTSVVIAVGVLLAGAVLAAVQHAEVVAHRVGEPVGSLVLAVAVTVIEVGLIVTLMADGGDKSEALARDTVFAAVMITCNGILGLSLLLGSLRYGLSVFNAEGSGAALATVATLSVLSLVLPTFTQTASGPVFTTGQLAFAALASLSLYLLFVVTQTGRHRDFYLAVSTDSNDIDDQAEFDPEHDDRPTRRAAQLSMLMLLIALVAVVGLAKVESPTIESAVESAGLPHAVVGIVIALLVLLPETLAAARAARRDHMQISINLAFGSAMASIGLTIPSIAIASIWLDGDLVLGLGDTQIVLLALTILVGTLTIVPGRATRLQGGVHLGILAAFIFLAMSP